MKEQMTIGQVSTATGIPAYRIKYAIDNLMIPGPSERFGNLRVFTKKDVYRIRKHFEGKKPSGKKNADK